VRPPLPRPLWSCEQAVYSRDSSAALVGSGAGKWQFGVPQLGVLQLGTLQFGVEQLGVLQFGVQQLDITTTRRTRRGRSYLSKLCLPRLDHRDILLSTNAKNRVFCISGYSKVRNRFSSEHSIIYF
jgi:hypothetical protein